MDSSQKSGVKAADTDDNNQRRRFHPAISAEQ